jgi:hypothetical protein
MVLWLYRTHLKDSDEEVMILIQIKMINSLSLSLSLYLHPPAALYSLPPYL